MSEMVIDACIFRYTQEFLYLFALFLIIVRMYCWVSPPQYPHLLLMNALKVDNQCIPS